jgi:hypothetical protein
MQSQSRVRELLAGQEEISGAPACRRLRAPDPLPPAGMEIVGLASRRAASMCTQAGFSGFSDNPETNRCFENRNSLFSMIEFPVIEKQGIPRQRIVLVDFFRGKQARAE